MPIHPKIRSTLLVCTGILLSLLFMLISIRQMDWTLVYKELSSIQIFPWFYVGVAIYLAGHCIRGLRTKMLVSNDANLSLLTASNIVIVGYAVNNIFPARVGELARAGMLCERTGIPVPQALTVIVIERIMDGISITLLCALGVYMSNTGIVGISPVLPFVFCLTLAALLMIVWAPQRFIDSVSKTAYTVYPRSHDVMLRLATAIVNGTTYLKSVKNLFTISSLSILIWICDVSLFCCIQNVLGIALSIWQIIFIMAIANLGILIITSPGYASPGYVGPFHALIIQSLTLLGCSPATALSYAIAINFAIYMPIMIWASAVLLWYGITLGLKVSLTRKARLHSELKDLLTMASPIATTVGYTAFDATPRFIYKLTEAVLPLNQYQVKDQQSIVTYCADFVHGEVRSLPQKIQLLFFIGMSGFNILVWLRFLRPFATLPLETRGRIINFWAYGKITLTRQLFKLIRSTALLAFFEHPDIVACLKNRVANLNFLWPR